MLMDAKLNPDVVEPIGEEWGLQFHLQLFSFVHFPQAPKSLAIQWSHSKGEYSCLFFFPSTGIQTAVRMLEHTLKNLNVYRDSKPKLDSIQTPYREQEKRVFATQNHFAFTLLLSNHTRLVRTAKKMLSHSWYDLKILFWLLHTDKGPSTFKTNKAAKRKGRWNDRGNQKKYNDDRSRLKYAQFR